MVDGGIDLRDGLIRRRMEHIGKVLLFSSGKGGVGKSTLSAASAVLLSSGGSVGILDLDLHGPSIPMMFGVRKGMFRESRTGLLPAKIDGIPIMSIDMFARGKGMPLRGMSKVQTMKEMMAITDFGPLDTLVVDLPPGTGDEFLTALEMFRERGGVVFVSQPSAVSWNVTRRAVELAQEMKSGIYGVVQNMGGPSKNIEKDCARMHVKSLGHLAFHYSIVDRPVQKLRGSGFMRDLKRVLENASLL